MMMGYSNLRKDMQEGLHSNLSVGNLQIVEDLQLVLAVELEEVQLVLLVQLQQTRDMGIIYIQLQICNE